MSSAKTRYILIASVLAVTYLVLIAPEIPNRLAQIEETYQMYRDPTAERAYEYGSKHFNAQSRSLYDINYAKYMFQTALKLDPQLKGVHHQLGRIAFLRADFIVALRYINAEIALPGGPVTPSSYYMRGLIEGYSGDYAAAVEDYATYLKSDPANWAAQNDYAWVLLKANRPADAFVATNKGLEHFSTNPWLLNSKATALYELGRYKEALDAARGAQIPASEITEAMWLTAYPGNDPRIAKTGIHTLQNSIRENIHRIEAKMSDHEVQ